MTKTTDNQEGQTERIVKVEASFSVVADGKTPMEARAEVARRVKMAIDGIEGKDDGCAVGTSGGGEIVQSTSASGGNRTCNDE